MATTPNVGLDLPDEQKTVADEVRRLAGNLVLLDGLIKALQTLVGQKAATGHTHTLAQIAGLVDELAAKMPADRQFSLADLVDVIGSVNAPAGYIFVKRADGKYEFVSSAAAIGTHKHVAADVIDFDEKVAAKIANLTGNAPAALDTLYELAAAIGNDPNIRQTLLNAIALKASLTGADFTGRVLATEMWVQSGAPTIRLQDTDWGPMYLHHNGGLMGFLNAGGGWSFYVNQGNGAIWTAQFGDLNQRIEDRAYAHADARGLAWRNDAIANIMPTIAAQGAGGVGTCAMLKMSNNTRVNPGDGIGGGSLQYCSADGSPLGYGVGGAWRCMGEANGRGGTNGQVTLWMRYA